MVRSLDSTCWETCEEGIDRVEYGACDFDTGRRSITVVPEFGGRRCVEATHMVEDPSCARCENLVFEGCDNQGNRISGVWTGRR